MTANKDPAPKDFIQKPALTVDEAATFLGLKKNYVYKLISQRKIPCYRPMAGRVFFKPSELEDFLFRNRQPAIYEEVANA
jgi:excisionase family DNA binding protein